MFFWQRESVFVMCPGKAHHWHGSQKMFWILFCLPQQLPYKRAFSCLAPRLLGNLSDTSDSSQYGLQLEISIREKLQGKFMFKCQCFQCSKSGGTWWALCKLPSVLYGPDEIPTNFSEAAGSTWIEAKSPSPSPLPQAERPCTWGGRETSQPHLTGVGSCPQKHRGSRRPRCPLTTQG